MAHVCCNTRILWRAKTRQITARSGQKMPRLRRRPKYLESRLASYTPLAVCPTPFNRGCSIFPSTEIRSDFCRPITQVVVNRLLGKAKLPSITAQEKEDGAKATLRLLFSLVDGAGEIVTPPLTQYVAPAAVLAFVVCSLREGKNPGFSP